MSFLKFGKRLQPAKKAWKIFTKKLHTKLLHKLNRSKTIKKPMKRLKATSKAVPWPASLAFKAPRKRRKQTIRSTHILRYNYDQRQKRPLPVYVDHLFMEPPAEQHLQLPGKITEHKGEVREMGLQKTEEAKLLHQFADDGPGTSEGALKSRDKISAADDMWESLGLASPLMHGINERAEEFITRIRGEMQLQEMMARGL